MNTIRFDLIAPNSPTARPAGPRPVAVAVADAAGMIWVHSNPAELYRWVSRRNDLLKTIAAASPDLVGPERGRAMAG